MNTSDPNSYDSRNYSIYNGKQSSQKNQSILDERYLSGEITLTLDSQSVKKNKSIINKTKFIKKDQPKSIKTEKQHNQLLELSILKRTLNNNKEFYHYYRKYQSKTEKLQLQRRKRKKEQNRLNQSIYLQQSNSHNQKRFPQIQQPSQDSQTILNKNILSKPQDQKLSQKQNKIMKEINTKDSILQVLELQRNQNMSTIISQRSQKMKKKSKNRQQLSQFLRENKLNKPKFLFRMFKNIHSKKLKSKKIQQKKLPDKISFPILLNEIRQLLKDINYTDFIENYAQYNQYIEKSRIKSSQNKEKYKKWIQSILLKYQKNQKSLIDVIQENINEIQENN